jgi:hypothetical protein
VNKLFERRTLDFPKIQRFSFSGKEMQNFLTFFFQLFGYDIATKPEKN